MIVSCICWLGQVGVETNLQTILKQNACSQHPGDLLSSFLLLSPKTSFARYVLGSLQKGAYT